MTVCRVAFFYTISVSFFLSSIGLCGTHISKVDGPSRPDDKTWSGKLRQLVEEKQVVMTKYDLELKYDYWNYRMYVRDNHLPRYYNLISVDDIMTAILPEEDQDEVPVGFSIVGHVGTWCNYICHKNGNLTRLAHLNLRPPYLPYKTLLATVLLDKNPTIRTVINKTDEVGEQSAYRTFNYELLAGDDDLNVEVSEENCLFGFDYSKVYWNSRLNTEHKRLVTMFEPGEAVCDVMASVGPFAVPAGRKRVFVWANDLNPDSYAGLVDAVERNKVVNSVFSFASLLVLVLTCARSHNSSDLSERMVMPSYVTPPNTYSIPIIASLSLQKSPGKVLLPLHQSRPSSLNQRPFLTMS